MDGSSANSARPPAHSSALEAASDGWSAFSRLNQVKRTTAGRLDFRAARAVETECERRIGVQRCAAAGELNGSQIPVAWISKTIWTGCSTDLAAWIARTARIAPSGPTTARRLHGPDSSFDRAPRGSRSIRRAPIQPYRAANPATNHLATAVPSSCRLLRLCGDPGACFPNQCADRPTRLCLSVGGHPRL